MTWRPDYCTVAELKAMLLPIGQTTSDYDTQMQIAVSAASQAIEKAANRQFGQVASAIARSYTFDGMVIEGRSAISIDDVMDTTNFAVAYGVHAPVLGTDFRLWPYNAAADGKPYTHLLLGTTTARFPYTSGDITVTAKWGWNAVPAAVHLAALIQAGRFFVRKDSLYGIAGSPDTGSETRLLAKLDPDVALNIGSVRRWWGAVGTSAFNGPRWDALDYYQAVGGWI